MAGPQCCVPAPSSAGLVSQKEEELVASLLSYVVSPPSGSNHRAVILVSDIFGMSPHDYDHILKRECEREQAHS